MKGFFRESATPYLGAIFVSYVFALFAQYTWPTTVILFSQNVAFVVLVLGILVSLCFWVVYSPESQWAENFWLVAIAWIVVWVVTVTLSIISKDLFNLVALLTPIPILMIALKKPSLPSAFHAGDLFVWSLIGIVILSQLMDHFGAKALQFEGWNRWPLIADLFGPLGRWKGPFGSVNYAGPAGAFILTFGLLRCGLKRATFMSVGALMVVASDSRSGMFMCLVGASTFVAVSPELGRRPRWRRLRLVPLISVVAAAIAYVATIDPSLNGRTPVWEIFFKLWQKSPLTGVGERGIQAVVEIGVLESWATHGHNIFIDPLGRYGLLGLLAVAGLLFSTGILIFKSWGAGFAVPTVLFAVILAGGVSDNLVDWRYVGIYSIPLLLAAILAGTWLPKKELFPTK